MIWLAVIGLVAIVLLVTALVAGYMVDETIATSPGELRKVQLAGRVAAHVHGNSVIRIASAGRTGEAEVMQGEAWFGVGLGRAGPFVVTAGGARIQTAGGGFGVRRHERGTEVLVTQGSVDVRSTAGDIGTRHLAAGDRAFVARQVASISVMRTPGEVARKLAWRQGRMVFSGQPLAEAVAEFNRYGPKEIVIVDPALGAHGVTGDYEVNAPERFASDAGAMLATPVAGLAGRILIGAGAPKR